MNRPIRILLLWLLVLALPVQGFAATVRQSCGTTHHHGFAALAMHHSHSHAYGDQRQYFQHDHATKASAGSDSASSDHHLSAASCSDCAACCTGAVMLPAMLNWAPMHASSIALTAPSSPPYSGYFPERLKRPPKHFLA